MPNAAYKNTMKELPPRAVDTVQAVLGRAPSCAELSAALAVTPTDTRVAPTSLTD